jgi:hypothetical protein
MEFPQGELDDADFVNLIFATDAASKSPTFMLVLADRQVLDTGAEGDPSVVRAIEVKPQAMDAATARRTDGDGAGGYYFTHDVTVDLRGFSSRKDVRMWYLSCTGLGAATQVRLIDYRVSKGVGS